MLRKSFLSTALVLTLSTAWAGAALADVAPPDACSSTSAAGTACNNAGTNGDEPGTCESSTCPHSGPGPDGGFVTTENPCMLCMPSSSSGSSCTVGAVGREGTIVGTMMLVGLAALLADRRSRSRRSRSS